MIFRLIKQFLHYFNNYIIIKSQFGSLLLLFPDLKSFPVIKLVNIFPMDFQSNPIKQIPRTECIFPLILNEVHATKNSFAFDTAQGNSLYKLLKIEECDKTLIVHFIQIIPNLHVRFFYSHICFKYNLALFHSKRSYSTSKMHQPFYFINSWHICLIFSFPNPAQSKFFAYFGSLKIDVFESICQFSNLSSI